MDSLVQLINGKPHSTLGTLISNLRHIIDSVKFYNVRYIHSKDDAGSLFWTLLRLDFVMKRDGIANHQKS